MGSTKNENETQGTSKPVTKAYGKIVLTLQNCLLPEEKLSQTPSQVDGLDNETETDLRIWGCELIQTAGILLKLPQVAMATGQVIFQRFYYCKSLVRHSVETTAMGCVCLASKIEEAPRRIRDVINVFHHIKQVNGGKTIQPMVLDQSYIALKNQVIKAERRVLKELGFCVHIKHPHKLIVMYLRILGLDKHKTLVQIAWNYMNDSLRTDIFLRYQPEIVACACIYLTARKLKMPLPKTPSWFTLFGATEADIREICLRILRLYSRPKPNVDELEKKVEELKKVYEDSRIKSRAANHLAGDSANSPSDSNSPRNKEKTGGSHNAWGGFISRSGSHAVSNSDNKNRSRSRSESLSPNSKHRSSKHHKKHSRKTSRSRSRSRTRSRSPSKSRKHKTRKNNRDKSRYRSRSRSHDRRSNSYERNDKYEKIDSKSEKYDKPNEKYDRYVDKSDKYREKSLDRNDKYSDKDRYKDEKYMDKYRDKSVDRSDKYLKDIDKYSSKERIKDRSNSLDRIESKYDTKKDRYSDSKFKDDKYISREDKYSNDKDRYSKRDKRSRDDADKDRERDRDIREKSSKDRRR